MAPPREKCTPTFKIHQILGVNLAITAARKNRGMKCNLRTRNMRRPVPVFAIIPPLCGAGRALFYGLMRMPGSDRNMKPKIPFARGALVILLGLFMGIPALQHEPAHAEDASLARLIAERIYSEELIRVLSLQTFMT